MNQGTEGDPLDALRAADPVDPDRLSSASLARIRARVREDVAMSTAHTEGRRWPVRLAALGAAGVAAAALALAVVFGAGGPGRPGIAPGTSVGTGSAACVEQYSLTTLAGRSIAFDGTVTAIDGDKVTFSVEHSYRGVSGGSVILEAAGMTGTAITSAGGPNLMVGERYLVAGEDRFAWGCGFTQPYEPAVAADWATAFGG